MAKTEVEQLRCEWARDPLGVGVRHPRLSWRLSGARRGLRQTAYEIEVSSGGSQTWATGRVPSSRSVGVPYMGEQLASREVYQWRVRVWNEREEVSDWSPPAAWEMGLLDATDWEARWISPDDDGKKKDRPCPMLRREFVLEDQPQRVRLYATAHGVYEVELNGRRVGQDLLRPGWTAYRRRLQYQTYDVGEYLRSGPNAVGVVLGDGWWRGEATGGRRRNWYGKRLALLMQLEVEFSDGRRLIVGSGPGWRWSTGPLRMADQFRGETYDARREFPGWSSAGFDEESWRPVPVIDGGLDGLLAQHGPSVRRITEIVPRRVLQTPAGETVADMGQNMAGWVRLRVRGPAGSMITLRHGETLDQRGNFTMRHLLLPGKGAMQEVRYTLRGGDEEIYEPRFSTAGFRYVAVDGWPGRLNREDLTAVVVHSDLAESGSFECSDQRLNQLQQNIVWTQRGNFIEVPTDCPTRERSGWTGDLQAFAPTAIFNMDVIALLERWLADLAADQCPDGKVPDVIPWVQAMFILGTGTGSVGWGDASAIVPWIVYSITGDQSVLERQFESMAAWVGHLERRAQHRSRRWRLLQNGPAEGHRRYILDSGFHWGDHYPIGRDSVRGVARGLFRPPALVATAFLARSAALTAAAAAVLGRKNEAARFEELHRHVKDAFQEEFLDPDGRLRPDEQYSYVLALAFDLLPEEVRERSAKYLVDAVRRAGNHATTGFMATPHLLQVLAETGHPEVAYDVLMQEEPPSWLDTIAKGATTIWESLRAITPEGKVLFRSLNHYTFGAVGDFLYRFVAGLDMSRIGMGQLRIHPLPGGGLDWARASYDSVHGPCAVKWQRDTTRMRVAATVPPNVGALVVLPGAQASHVLESGVRVDRVPGIADVRQADDSVVVSAASGSYEFEYPR